MKMYSECVPCLFKIALDNMVTHNIPQRHHRRLLARYAEILFSLPDGITAPEVTAVIARLIDGYNHGRRDAYRDEKRRSTKLALAVCPDLKKQLAKAPDPLRLALKLSMAGNIIDSGINPNLDVKAEIAKLAEPGAYEDRIFMDYRQLRAALKKARTVLFVGDNAGETVFDRLLIEEILRLYPRIKATYAVRAFPTLNDALVQDAVEAGLHEVADIITSGSDFPGTSLQASTRQFRQAFYAADVVISKGQGNYESLTDSDRDIFFMLMLKCPVVARHARLKIGSYLLRHARPPKTAARRKK